MENKVHSDTGQTIHKLHQLQCMIHNINVTGIVKDQTGTYTYVFYLTGIISLSLCAVMVAILVKHGRSSSGDSDKQDRSKAQQDK